MTPELYEAHDRLEADHWWFEGRRRVVQAVLEAHLEPRPGRRILDVGCGTGGMFELLDRYGTVDGAEYSPDARARATRKHPTRRIEPCALPQQLPQGTWDLITCFDVLEHVPAPIESLKAMRSRLSAGGQLVLTVPAFQVLWSHHDEVNGHRQRYSRVELLGELWSAGFRVTTTRYFNSLLFPAVLGARLAARLPLPGRDLTAAADLAPVFPPINAALRALFSLERHLVPAWSLPFGVSLLAVASRDDEVPSLQ